MSLINSLFTVVVSSAVTVFNMLPDELSQNVPLASYCPLLGERVHFGRCLFDLREIIHRVLGKLVVLKSIIAGYVM